MSGLSDKLLLVKSILEKENWVKEPERIPLEIEKERDVETSIDRESTRRSVVDRVLVSEREVEIRDSDIENDAGSSWVKVKMHGDSPKSETIEGNIEVRAEVGMGMPRESEDMVNGEVLKWDRDKVFRVYSLM